MKLVHYKYVIAAAACFFAPIVASTGAVAMSRQEKSQLEELDPQTRLEQRCDLEAMERISREEHRFDVDKVLAYAFADPAFSKNGMRTNGAAFRSREHWYRLSYSCQTDAGHINVTSFEYRIGEEVPQSQWAAHYLVP